MPTRPWDLQTDDPERIQGSCSDYLPARFSNCSLDGSYCRHMFLAYLAPEGQSALWGDRDFVRGQVQHYAVPFDESQFSGNGAHFDGASFFSLAIVYTKMDYFVSPPRKRQTL
ncbi:uncharacterized protein BO80DRAFT_443588 [Aspergillus ibericus CBS 121593]|uniref:Uncharacterized protein n=1 Tax=Aspergillus ibericus CBS 121593 TaxID=1448316 RepID=A0A395H5U2_9EURO|nr:hypothetical protein BO80DRAFT_443588 [Aspergillus ibericus CBS 121593]RAL02278.1 hypothetical protein BO80DRAFT_443588 [Aspergillus ibericus CBS 121593]